MDLNEIWLRLKRLENWRQARWGQDDLYKPLPRPGDPILVEPSVVSALPYLIKPGDTVFDVGAQAGHVAHAMSTHVGPRGLVIAFEASVRTARKLRINLADAALRNVQYVNVAIGEREDYGVKIYHHKSQLNDSISIKHVAESKDFNQNFFDFVTMTTIDQYCSRFDVSPTLIKMDIEGYEFQALNGAQITLSKRKPHLLLEEFDPELECFNFLTERGYNCYEATTLNLLNKSARSKSREINYLYLHQDKINTVNLPKSIQMLSTLKFSESSGVEKVQVSGDIELSAPKHIVAELIEADFRNSGFCIWGILDDRNRIIARYQGEGNLLTHHYRKLSCHVPRHGQYRVFVKTQTLPSTPIGTAVISEFK